MDIIIQRAKAAALGLTHIAFGPGVVLPLLAIVAIEAIAALIAGWPLSVTVTVAAVGSSWGVAAIYANTLGLGGWAADLSRKLENQAPKFSQEIGRASCRERV